MAEVALHLQRHRHTHTCAKNSGTQSDKGCRLLMPRPLQQHTELLDVDGVDVLLVRRLAKDLVPYWTFLQLAMPTNMAMYISAEQSRYMRACTRICHLKAKPRPNGKSHGVPSPPPTSPACTPSSTPPRWT